jgi:hypothetical protein
MWEDLFDMGGVQLSAPVRSKLNRNASSLAANLRRLLSVETPSVNSEVYGWLESNGVDVDNIQQMAGGIFRLLDSKSNPFARVWIRDALLAINGRWKHPRAANWTDKVIDKENIRKLHMGVVMREKGRWWFKQVYPDRNSARLTRILSHRTASRTSYVDDKDPQFHTARHFGQRKLLISEIEFLTKHAIEDDTIVYAGAAPGTHMPLLSEMFRTLNLKYVLVDPHFKGENRRPRGCECIEEYFLNEGKSKNCAEYWRKQSESVLFISDIRTCSSSDNKTPTEQDVKNDMEMQLGWVNTMRPRAGMLKFKLPFDDTSVPYLKGNIHLPIWGRQRTAESRLIFTNDDAFDGDTVIKHTYSAGAYEQEMYHFNTVTRMSMYPCTKLGCLCYDCVAESAVLMAYVERFEPRLTSDESVERVDELREKVTRQNKEQNPARCAEVVF